ncbi:MarR family winged helix-turn-helix transcriptional regulator [Aliidongia dinghuensis]|uniref:MarR family winged helix-turn-helix transcriptional regulator n=1 Tax=Aliidongia dinghuensis TaxID=1867774 RepID=UPI001665E5B6|nr:MarR family transcriptional regulator [Aliidongia dinghuensis]
MVVARKPMEAAELADALGPALLRLVRQFRAGMPAAGLPPAQVMLLKRVLEQPGIGVSALAEAERISRPTVSSQIRQLEAAGLVARLPAPDEDRRRVGLAITPSGRALLNAVKDGWTRWLAQRLTALPESGRATLADALPHLLAMSAQQEQSR